jgi:hypothetical protein
VADACGFTGDRGAESSAAPAMIGPLSERSVMPQVMRLAGAALIAQEVQRRSG